MHIYSLFLEKFNNINLFKIKMSIIQEHSIKIDITPPKKDVHAKMEIFYNPLMVSNRNISILLLNCIANQKMNLADPLAGSGIRSLRFLKELKKDKINYLAVNDLKENFITVFKENLQRNQINLTSKINLNQEDANLFLLNQIKHPVADSFCGYFDYIDLDPFGSPNPFIPAAISRICRKGIIAVTATDTAALTGTYSKVTKRKYWAVSLRNHLMHEVGLRILIRKVQLEGVQFDKALTPILSYHKDHYYRIYFCAEKGKEKCDEIIKQHQYLLFCPKCLTHQISNYNQETCSCKNNFIFAGPLWTGKLLDQKLISKMVKENPFPEEQKFLNLLKEESTIDGPGFYDLHVLARKYKLAPPRMESILKPLAATRTQFSLTGIKTEKKLKEIVSIINSVIKK